MSQLKVNSIRATAASSDALTLASDGTVAANLTSISGSQFSERNLIWNPEMLVSARSTSAVTNSASTTALKYETLDRWGYWAYAASIFTLQQVSEAPPGFSRSLKFTSAGARTMVDDDYFSVGQRFEGQDLQYLNWGTSNARACVLSFWVKSSLTGTFSGYLHGTDNYKPTYVFTYSISSANTWEKKTITITAPGTGQANDFGSAGSNAKGLELGFNLGVGTTYATSDTNQWTEGFFKMGTTSTVDVVATNAATWQITGVQFEANNSGVATEFVHRTYGDELRRCQRYYYKNAGNKVILFSDYNNSTSIFWANVFFPTTMRAAPTVTVTGLAGGGSIAETVKSVDVLSLKTTTGATHLDNSTVIEADAEL